MGILEGSVFSVTEVGYSCLAYIVNWTGSLYGFEVGDTFIL